MSQGDGLTTGRSRSRSASDKLRLIYVEWFDAVSTQGWESVEEHTEPHLCKSIGWLVTENKKFIVVAATQGGEGKELETNNRISIPTGWIKSKRIFEL